MRIKTNELRNTVQSVLASRIDRAESLPVHIDPFPFLKLLILTVPPLLVTAALWSLSAREITPVQGAITVGLLAIPWASLRKWSSDQRSTVPLFALVSLMYWISFGLPLFWEQPHILGSNLTQSILGPDAVTEALLMALLGVIVLWAGMSLGIGRRFALTRQPSLRHDLAGRVYLWALVIGGLVLRINEDAPWWLGPGGRQLIVLLQYTVPLVAFIILFREWLRGRAFRLDRVLLLSFVGIYLVVGAASGWLSEVLQTLVISAFVYISERKRIPLVPVAILVAMVLFLQVGKGDFRAKYWYGENNQASLDERAWFWVNASFDKWGQVLDAGNQDDVTLLVQQTLGRFSLLSQAAQVWQFTPSIVPFQEGQLYSYMLITLVPRFLWPDKPIVNDANRFYQVAYGITREENLDQVSIAVGVLAESYIGFGWYGVIGIMLLLGIFFDFFSESFLRYGTSLLFGAIGLVLAVQFIHIEAQMAQYLGNVVQLVVVTVLVFAPMFDRHTNHFKAFRKS